MSFTSVGMVKLTVRDLLPMLPLTLMLLAVELTTSPRNGLGTLSSAFGSGPRAHPPLTMGVPTAQTSMNATIHAAGADVFIWLPRLRVTPELRLFCLASVGSATDFQAARRRGPHLDTAPIRRAELREALGLLRPPASRSSVLRMETGNTGQCRDAPRSGSKGGNDRWVGRGVPPSRAFSPHRPAARRDASPYLAELRSRGQHGRHHR